MTPHPAASEVPGLQLHVAQHHGQEPGLVWSWPEHATCLGLDAVLAETGVTDVQLLAHAHLCTLESAGTSQNPIWLFCQGCTELVCSINGRILEMGSHIRLDHDDEIEFGLVRLGVALSGSSHQSHFVISHDDASSKASIDEPFELTDLESLPGSAAVPGRERYGSERADIGDLISLAQESLSQDSQSHKGHESARHLSEKASNSSTLADQAVALEDLLDRLSPVPDEAGDLEVDPLEALHTRYLAKLRNPFLSDPAIAWQESGLDDQFVNQDPMRHWLTKAGSQVGLYDLLGHSTSIDFVMADLDPLASSDVMEPETHDSVMHLFAPDDLRLQDQDPLDLFMKRSLPELTRSEHHSMSLDSVMPFIGGETLPSTPKKS